MIEAAKLLRNYVGDDSAATAVEYGLIAVILSIAILSAVVNVGINLQRIFGTVSF